MKRTISGLVLFSASSVAMAVAPGGPDCGWGNMLMDGQAGLGSHILASCTNGTSGNATFGMTTGTNGCSADGTLTYGGKSLLGSIMDEFTEDVARGEGDALNAVAVAYGIDPTDRAAFAQLTHKNFKALFPHENVTAAQVDATLTAIMKSDLRFSKYVA